MRQLAHLLSLTAFAALGMACGPGDDCAVTLTCAPPPTGSGGSGQGASGGTGGIGQGAAGGTGGAGQGGSGGSGGSAPTCGNDVVDPGELCFTAPYTAYPTLKNEAWDLVIHDCDGDGDLDVITSDTTSSSLTSLQNDGTGALGDPTSETTPVSEDPYGLTLGQFDVSNPGLEIVMGADVNWSTVYGFEGACQFNYLRHFYHDNSASESVTVLHLDGTAPDEVAVAPMTISWSFNGGAGQNISGDPEATDPRGLSAGNLDEIGGDDLIYVDPGTGKFYWARGFVNGATGSLSHVAGESMVVGVGAYDSDTGDLDGDLRSDVVVVNRETATLSVFINNGASSIGFNKLAESSTGAADSRSVVLADIDDDGDLDAVVANANMSQPDGSVSIFLNNGAGVLALDGKPRVVRRRPFSVAVADMNGDGALDIITAHGFRDGTTAHVSVLLAQP